MSNPLMSADTCTLASSDDEHQREVSVSLGKVIRIEDEDRLIYITLEKNGNLRVEIIPENPDEYVLPILPREPEGALVATVLGDE